MEESVRPDDESDAQMRPDQETEGEMDEKESFSGKSKKSSYRQKYKRAWELDPDLRGIFKYRDTLLGLCQYTHQYTNRDAIYMPKYSFKQHTFEQHTKQLIAH